MTENLSRTVRRLVSAGSSLDIRAVIKANEGGRSPREPYATLLLIQDDQYGTASQLRSDAGATDTETEYVQFRLAAYSLTFFGDDDRAAAFLVWLETEAARLHEEQAGIRIQRATARKMDSVVPEKGAAFEGRLEIDLHVGYTARVDQRTGRILSAPYVARLLTQTARGTINAA